MKNQLSFFLLILIFTSSCSVFQKTKPQTNFERVSPFRVSTQKEILISELKQEDTKFEVLETDIHILKQISERSPDEITLYIPSKNRQSLELELKKINIFTQNFQVILSSSNSKIDVKQGVHYRGKIKGDKQSVVAVSIFENEVIGVISSYSGNLVLGKLKGERWTTEHIIYDDKTINKERKFECGTLDDGIGYNGKDLEVTRSERLIGNCVRLYIEVDFDIFTNQGGINPTMNFVTGLLNQVITLYANESINANISEIKIWNVPSPYSGSSNSTMLNSFQSNTGAFNGDLAQLLSYKASGGIAAGFAGICNSNVDYSKSFSSIGSAFSTVPTYSWSVMVIAHEFGHLFGSRHTHACVWNGNNTAIDGCAGYVEGSCAIPGIPSQGGTIMSYCHLQSVGINFSLGFGVQPGNVIRSSLANAPCPNSNYIYALVTRDNLSDMYLFPFISNTFYGNCGKIGHGWNFTHYLPADWTGDGVTDMIVRASDGKMYLYPFQNNTFYGSNAGQQVGHGWNFTDYFIGNWTGDGSADLIVRASDGKMYLYPFQNNTFYSSNAGQLVGHGWNFTHYFPGDWTGDGITDMVVRASDGKMYLYPFQNNTFYSSNAGQLVGHGWNFTDYFIGNWTGDGTADLIVRASDGKMYLYPFRNNTFYSSNAGQLVGHGWNFTHYFPADWIGGDGITDMVVRASDGKMYLYPFQNNTFYSSNAGQQVGHGWNFADYFIFKK